MDNEMDAGSSGRDAKGESGYGRVFPGPGSGSYAAPGGTGSKGQGPIGNVDPLTNGWSPPSVNGQDAKVVPMRDFEGMECETEVEIVVTRFTSFGRLAHLRRSLLALPHVSSARIIRYSGFTAFFTVTVAPGTRAGALALPGTRLVSSDGRRIELRVAGA